MVLHFFNSFRVWFYIFSTRFECGFFKIMSLFEEIELIKAMYSDEITRVDEHFLEMEIKPHIGETYSRIGLVRSY